VPKGFKGFQRGVPNVNKGKKMGRRPEYAAAKKMRDVLAALAKPVRRSVPLDPSIPRGVGKRGIANVNRGRVYENTSPRYALKKVRRERLSVLMAYARAHPPTPGPRVTLAMTNPYQAQPGQVWLNTDGRAGKHWKAGAPAVRLERIEPPYAFGFWCSRDGVLDLASEMRVARIRLDMLRPWESRKARRNTGGHRGWRLLG
jgi:hypothetical protein